MGKYKLPVDYTQLTFQERREVRMQYIKEQNGLCMYCKGSIYEEPPKEITDNSSACAAKQEPAVNSANKVRVAFIDIILV